MDKRFEFGQNWQTYLSKITDENIQASRKSLEAFEGRQTLAGLRFLDIGCGSGIHSYVAYLMGASEIVSFDYDAFSVEACQQLKKLKAPGASNWTAVRGDILSGKDQKQWSGFDIVYAWGSLHHTGAMWEAIEAAGSMVKPGGLFHLAIYNKHWTSPIWKQIKHLYCASPQIIQKVLLNAYAGLDWLRIALTKHQNPKTYIHNYFLQRGMIWKEDLRDWLGGYPYEYASPAEIREFVIPRGFLLLKEAPNRNIGCSEFLFRRAIAC